MAESDRREQPKSEAENENWVNAEEFRDLPTCKEHGPFISHFDALLWVSDYLTASEGWRAENPAEWDEWDEAERRISALCQTDKLEALGLRAAYGSFENNLSRLPPEAWPRLHIAVMDGQPADDRERHGGRCYGEARWLDPLDAGVPTEIAWTAVCFRKPDVLKHWPMNPRIRKHFSKRAVFDALVSYLKQNADLTRKQAVESLKGAGYKISKHSFQKIWPDAREGAGLPRLALAGRKRKFPCSTTQST